MKYLSSKPFTGGANSQAFVDRWDEAFGKKDSGTSAPDSIPGRPCGTVENGSPCILRSEHGGGHYTEAEKAAFNASTAKREDENLDFLVRRRLESYGDPQPCDGDEEVSAAKERIPFTEFDRQTAMIGLERRLKKACLDRLVLTLTEDEIFSLLLLFKDLKDPAPRNRNTMFVIEALSPPHQWHIEAPDTFVGFFRRLFVPWVKEAETPFRGIRMPDATGDPARSMKPEEFLGLFPWVNRLGKPRPRFP